MLAWLEVHQELSGWAQFLGAMLALILTYLTAFSPIWRRKRQLKSSAVRLLAHGYEVIESYSRTSEYGDLFPLSLRQAALSMGIVTGELSRFPIYDLDDHDGNSLARRLVAMSHVLGSMQLELESMAVDLTNRSMTQEDRECLRCLLKLALSNAESLLLGKVMTRPDPPFDLGVPGTPT